jgi:hypothetical protein
MSAPDNHAIAAAPTSVSSSRAEKPQDEMSHVSASPSADCRPIVRLQAGVAQSQSSGAIPIEPVERLAGQHPLDGKRNPADTL